MRPGRRGAWLGAAQLLLAACDGDPFSRLPLDPASIRAAGELMVVQRASSHAEHLLSIARQHPGLRWRESERSVENLLEQVGAGDIPCTVADSLTLEVNRRHVPELDVAMALGAAREQGLDEHSWSAVKQPLPLRTDPRYFRRLEHGYARGSLRYVALLWHFEDLLVWHLAVQGGG